MADARAMDNGLGAGTVFRELFFTPARVLVAHDARRVAERALHFRAHRADLAGGPRDPALREPTFSALVIAAGFTALREREDGAEAEHVTQKNFHGRNTK